MLNLYSRPVSLAEWLRRLTRNQMGFARAGSNPAADEFFNSQRLDGILEIIIQYK